MGRGNRINQGKKKKKDNNKEAGLRVGKVAVKKCTLRLPTRDAAVEVCIILDKVWMLGVYTVSSFQEAVGRTKIQLNMFR